MQIELIVQDSKSGNAWDMSELVNSGINWETNIAEQPGKLTFEYIDQENISINEGSPVSLRLMVKVFSLDMYLRRDGQRMERFQ